MIEKRPDYVIDKRWLMCSSIMASSSGFLYAAAVVCIER
jgi:hypothetical protein